MDFPKLLLKVSSALGSEEVTALAFLCTDLLNRNITSVESPNDLFRLLMDKDYLSSEQPELLTELLLTIQRPRLLHDVGLRDNPCTTRSLISSYRKLLYRLSEEITAADLKTIKFILSNQLPRRKLEENVVSIVVKITSTLAVFVEMENMALISETNLKALEDILNSGLDTYEMTAAKRGICVIVNNFNFTGSTMHLSQRKGTMADEASLNKVFEWLGFEVQIHRDCGSDKMLSVFSELSSRDHSQMDCVVCCILSHGLEGGVYGVDGGIVKLKELTDLFNGFKCPSLVKKPKLFFIQACQGNVEQRPVETDGKEWSQIHSDAMKGKESSPAVADFLLGMATVPFHVSFRDRENGTWYIQSLCQNLIEMVPSGYDLMSILTKVNADVGEKSVPYSKGKQMPQPAFSLRKRVIFPIPEAPPPNLSN
ncbi:caspase-8 [Xenentodon cancila]